MWSSFWMSKLVWDIFWRTELKKHVFPRFRNPWKIDYEIKASWEFNNLPGWLNMCSCHVVPLISKCHQNICEREYISMKSGSEPFDGLMAWACELTCVKLPWVIQSAVVAWLKTFVAQIVNSNIKRPQIVICGEKVHATVYIIVHVILK